MRGIAGEPQVTLVMIRHGAIVRPTDTSNFDRAPLSSEGWQQMNRLASESFPPLSHPGENKRTRKS